LSDRFPIENGLKRGNALLFKFALKYDIKKVQEDQVGLKLSMTYQLLPYADDVYLLRDNMDTIKNNSETLFNASKRLVWK
jgi:hypothetical protein